MLLSTTLIHLGATGQCSGKLENNFTVVKHVSENIFVSNFQYNSYEQSFLDCLNIFKEGCQVGFFHQSKFLS